VAAEAMEEDLPNIPENLSVSSKRQLSSAQETPMAI
jgi:hypothetical protein